MTSYFGLHKTDLIAEKVICAVAGQVVPLGIQKQFGQYDKPIGEMIKHPDHFRVEAVGWDAKAQDVFYVLCDRVRSTGSLIVCKQSQLLMPILPRGALLRVYKFTSEQFAKRPYLAELVDIVRWDAVKVTNIRAVKKKKDDEKKGDENTIRAHETAQYDYEYRYELEFTNTDAIIVSESKMQEYFDACIAFGFGDR